MSGRAELRFKWTCGSDVDHVLRSIVATFCADLQAALADLPGITVTVDTVEMASTEAATTTGLAGQSTGSVIAVDTVGADVVPEPSGNPTNTEGGPPAGA